MTPGPVLARSILRLQSDSIGQPARRIRYVEDHPGGNRRGFHPVRALSYRLGEVTKSLSDRLRAAHWQKPTILKAIILQLLLEQCHAYWLVRNLHLHGTDPRNTGSYKHLHLLVQVTGRSMNPLPSCYPWIARFLKFQSKLGSYNPSLHSNHSTSGLCRREVKRVA
jgi:hypothetical protein